MMTNREQLKTFFSADKSQIKLRDHELYDLLKKLQPDDVIGLDEHHKLIELIAALRQIIEENNALNGENFNRTLKSLLSVGEDGLYSDPLRFLFELIQNVDDCEFDDISSAKLRIEFRENTIQLIYNEHGFTPFNVFAITGIAEAAKNIDNSKVEIGEKGLGFKSVFGIAQSVLIQSGFFSFRLNKDHFTIPVPEYDHFSRVQGTRLTLTLGNPADVDRVCRLIKERYCKSTAIFRQNPMLFLNKLTELELLVDHASKQLLFIAERKKKLPVNNHLSVERDVAIRASLKSLAGGMESEFDESIIGDRYTYLTTYDHSMCQARYGVNTRLTQKLMTLQVIFPHEEYLAANRTIEKGALYSFLPTQVAINAPMIVHAPFKLDGSREYVDSQSNNAWFRHTIKRLIEMLNESLADLAQRIHENVLRYIPKRQMPVFDGNKSRSLFDSGYKGESLLTGRIFWASDGKFHTLDEIKVYGGGLSAAEQRRIYSILKASYQLFVMPVGLKAADYGIAAVEDPYRTLLVRALFDAKIMRLALPILCDWIQRTSGSELTQRLDAYIPVAVKRYAANYIGGNDYKRKLSLDHVEAMAQYPVFSKPFCEWVQRRFSGSGTDFPFEFNAVCKTGNITTIDPENPFDISDVGPNAQKYLKSVQCRYMLVSGDCICIPTPEGLVLSCQRSLDLFAAFCKVMDKNTQFDITLRLMANSKRLNDAEGMMPKKEFLQLLKDVRVSGKMALGRSYGSYFNLLYEAGASPVRFMNELVQNADDCDYPENVVPHLVIRTTDKTLSIQYNEMGFTKHNVRAITAIGESTKRQLLGGKILSKETIGEKGIGFKAVFSVAQQVFIHSNGFHFGLKASAPTVPILDIEEKNSGELGTYMEMELKSPLPNFLFSRGSLLSLCLCLRNIKQITCNNIHVQICDADGMRKITIDDAVYEYEVYQHSFTITDRKALVERQHGSRVISPKQSICCYIPRSARQKSTFYLYSGLPTKIQINIPMYIDAPFELTTPRDDVLENTWNCFVRDHVYRAIYEYTNQAKEKLLIQSLRFVAVRLQSNMYQNNTFEANAFLNALALNDYARFNVYVPTANSQLRLVNLTKKYPAFIRRMISSALANTSEAANTLNYSDDEYNAAYLYLGGQIAKTKDILEVIKKVNLQELLKEEGFRKQLYAWLEEERGITSNARSLCIVPVWDSTKLGVVRYVNLEDKPVYIEHGKNRSDSSEYWVLNETQMSPAQFMRILDRPIETMDRDHAIQMYKKKLLATIRPLSAELAYRYLLNESSTNSLFMDALRSMTSDEQRWIALKNRDGETVDSHHVFTLDPRQMVFGKMLRKYIASDECYAMAKALGRAPVEEIQIGDLEDYEGMLNSEDLEDLLKSEFPRIRSGRWIARKFYDDGKVEQDAAIEYGLVYTSALVETENWQFPKSKLISAERVRSDMLDRMNKAPRIISKTVEKRVRGWISPKDGSFCEFDHRTGRQEQLANYAARENSNYCFCQMCKKPKQKYLIEVACIQQEPSLFLPQIYLSLCLECSKRFQELRARKKSNFSHELFQKIISARMTGAGCVTVDMEDEFNLSLTFTETHLAEIQAVLPELAHTAYKPVTVAQSTSHESVTEPTVNTTRLLGFSTACRQPAVDPASDERAYRNRYYFTVHVTGEEAGDYWFYVYGKKLKQYTDAKPEERYIPIVHQGREKWIQVQFVPEERTIYVARNIYNPYAEVIRQMNTLAMLKEVIR